jgi:hypothetical protein
MRVDTSYKWYRRICCLRTALDRASKCGSHPSIMLEKITMVSTWQCATSTQDICVSVEVMWVTCILCCGLLDIMWVAGMVGILLILDSVFLGPTWVKACKVVTIAGLCVLLWVMCITGVMGLLVMYLADWDVNCPGASDGNSAPAQPPSFANKLPLYLFSASCYFLAKPRTKRYMTWLLVMY